MARSRTLRPDRRRSVATLLATTVGVVGLAACGGGPARTAGAPVVTVATGLWPLAQIAGEIGRGNVRVVDVVPDGNDPSTYILGAGAIHQVRTAAVALQVGGGLQPSFAAAAAANPHTVTIAPVGGSSYVWLNPYDMEAVGRQVAAALTQADPAAKATFAGGLDDLEASLGALDVDYQSTLSVCPDQTLVTVTDAFADLHPRYPVVDRAVTTAAPHPLPSPATVRAEVAAIKATGAGEIYDESWIPQSDIIEASVVADVKVGTIDTLAGPPAGGYPQGGSTLLPYVAEMERVLSTLTSALHCPAPGD